MGSTVSLRRFFAPAPLALEVRPLARLAHGRVEPLTATFLPSEGPCRLVVWRPGPEEPAFVLIEGALARVGRSLTFLGPSPEGWVVLWSPLVGRAAGAAPPAD